MDKTQRRQHLKRLQEIVHARGDDELEDVCRELSKEVDAIGVKPKRAKREAPPSPDRQERGGRTRTRKR